MLDKVIENKIGFIDSPGGQIVKAMKKDDIGYKGFGEVYFSILKPGITRAWKRHREMTLNIIVPSGKILFVIHDYIKFKSLIISKDNFIRLTVPPMLWYGFKALGNQPATIMNIASIIHNENELENIDVNKFKYNWEKFQ